jgi:hypothetical protein
MARLRCSNHPSTLRRVGNSRESLQHNLLDLWQL